MARESFKITVKVSGLENLLNTLEGKKSKLEKALKEGVNMGAAIVEAKAREIVPVRTGNLMRSIMTEFKNDGFTALVGPDIKAAPYGYYVEFGRSKSGKQPPYPFAGRHYMETSFYQTKDRVENIIKKSINDSIS